jgi:hypothetical protein
MDWLRPTEIISRPAGLCLALKSKKMAGHENTTTFSRSQQMRLVPPRSPLYSKRGIGGGGINSDGESVRSPLGDSGMYSLSRSSSVRQPKILEDTSRLLSEKPREVPRSVVQVSRFSETIMYASVHLKNKYFT